MKSKTDLQSPEPLSPKEKQAYACVVIFLSGYIVWLTMFSPSPKFYSYNEYNRAEVACVGNAYVGCVAENLTKWRKTAPPDAPRGSL